MQRFPPYYSRQKASTKSYLAEVDSNQVTFGTVYTSHIAYPLRVALLRHFKHPPVRRIMYGKTPLVYTAICESSVSLDGIIHGLRILIVMPVPDERCREARTSVDRWRGRSTYSMRLASLPMRPLAHTQIPISRPFLSLLLQPLFLTLSSIVSGCCSNTYQTHFRRSPDFWQPTKCFQFPIFGFFAFTSANHVSSFLYCV